MLGSDHKAAAKFIAEHAGLVRELVAPPLDSSADADASSQSAAAAELKVFVSCWYAVGTAL